MKKLLAFLLIMVMILGMLAGCSKKKDTTNNDSGNNAANQQTKAEEGTGTPTQPKPEQNFGVAIGTLLDAPEKIFAAEATKMLYVSFDEKVDGKTEAVEISVVVAEDGTRLIYAVNGPGKNKEAVYEIAGEGIIKYIKGAANEPFKLDDKTTADEVKNEFTTLADYILVFAQCQDALKGIKYRKAANVTVACPTGDVYIYDLISEGKVTGQICIDKDTGLLVKIKDAENTEAIAVQEFKTADVQIPELAKGEATPDAEQTPDADAKA